MPRRGKATRPLAGRRLLDDFSQFSLAHVVQVRSVTSDDDWKNARGAVESMWKDGDLVVWNPEESAVIDRELLRFRHRLTPYEGRTVEGKVIATFLRGMNIYARGKLSVKPQGKRVSRRSETE